MTRPNDPMTICLDGADCIARASSEGDGRQRWTCLSVYMLPDRRYLAQSQGMSLVPGERTKTRRLASTSLERALKLFDDSDLGVAVSETAREWAESRAEGAPGVWTDREALARLYGENVQGAKGRGDKGYAGMIAADFGVGESTVRAAIANDTPIKVPLAAVMPFLDLAKLSAARESRNGR